jgi:hypothetical protein
VSFWRIGLIGMRKECLGRWKERKNVELLKATKDELEMTSRLKQIFNQMINFEENVEEEY